MLDNYALNADVECFDDIIEIEIEKELSALKKIEWFHGYLNIQDAERKITSNGDFLVRISKDKINKFILTTKWNGIHFHVSIHHELSDTSRRLRYFIHREIFFYTVTELVSFHKVEQYPLPSGAVLVHSVGVIESDDVSRRFRRSVRRTGRPQSGTLPRPVSETRLYKRHSDIVTDTHTGPALRPTSAKPHFRLSTSAVISSRMRPANCRVRTASLHDLSNGRYPERGPLDRRASYPRCDRETPRGTSGPHAITTSSTERGPLRVTSDDCSDIQTPTPNVPNVFTFLRSLSLGSFLNLNLSTLPLYCLGPIEGALDTASIHKVATFLLSQPNHSNVICSHLLDELHRIFRVVSKDVSISTVGYRYLFLPGSEKCQNDLSIRQKTLTNFIMATIVSAHSNEDRVQLILFWMKCADVLLTEMRDMFHFRSVVTAILSQQILTLKVWRRLYQNYPSMKSRIESMRNAVSNGCFMRTEIDECVPDLVHLYNIFACHLDNFDAFCEISLGIMRWSAQSFDESTTWLTRIRKQQASVFVNPFFRELVQTETLLALNIGRNSVTTKDLDHLMQKVDQCIGLMADLHGDDPVK